MEVLSWETRCCFMLGTFYFLNEARFFASKFDFGFNDCFIGIFESWPGLCFARSLV